MDFNLNDDQKALQGNITKFIEKECPLERSLKIDREGVYPFELHNQLAELGYFSIPFPRKYGGMELGNIEVVILMEELARRLLPLQMTYQVSVVVSGQTILKYGNEDQKSTFLPKIASGKTIFCIAYTEPNAGSDAGSITTTAAKEGNKYILSGQKIFITSADIADYAIISTRTNKEAPKHKGITTFILDLKLPGIKVNKIEKLGVSGGSYCEIFLEDVEVDENSVLGILDRGWEVKMAALEIDRICAAARWTGLGCEAINYALDYARKRVQFDRPIGSYQAIKNKFAEMHTYNEASRLLVYKAALLLDQKVKCTRESSVAKLFASQNVLKIVHEVMQIMGSYGYAMEYHAQKFLRDAQFATIGGGTSEIQKMIIAREMGLV